MPIQGGLISFKIMAVSGSGETETKLSKTYDVRIGGRLRFPIPANPPRCPAWLGCEIDGSLDFGLRDQDNH